VPEYAGRSSAAHTGAAFAQGLPSTDIDGTSGAGIVAPVPAVWVVLMDRCVDASMVWTHVSFSCMGDQT
jgi:hypothetical protein